MEDLQQPNLAGTPNPEMIVNKPSLLEIAKKADEPQKIALTHFQSDSINEFVSQMQPLERQHDGLKTGLQILLNHISRELGLPKDKKFTLSPDRTMLIEVKEGQ